MDIKQSLQKVVELTEYIYANIEVSELEIQSFIMIDKAEEMLLHDCFKVQVKRLL